MRILVVSNRYPPDSLNDYEIGCRQAVDAFRAAGHEALVLTAAPRRAIPLAADEPHLERRLQHTDFGDPQSLAANSFNAFNIHLLCDALRTFEPDVTYLWNLIGLGGLGLIAALQHTGTPWVMHLLDNGLLSLCEAVPGVKREAVQRTFLQNCRGRFISCSQTLLDEIAAGGLLLAKRATLIPNWVASMNALPKREYRPEGILRIVSAGMHSHSNGTDILIEAAALLRDRGYSDFTIDLFGKSSDPAFESMILACELSDFVRFRGVARYVDYDAFALPIAEHDSYGFAAMEAAASGCLPLISDLCGLAEWLLHGVDCLKVHREPESWADAIASLLDGAVPLEALGARAAKVIHRDFRLPVILPRIVEVLERAVRDSDTPRRTEEDPHRVAILAEQSFYRQFQERAA